MVNIKQIASDIGVSAATVSNALTGKGRVSREMIERIQSRAEELGYRPSIAARALKSGRSGILGLVMPDLTNPLFPRIAQTLSMAADSHRFGVLIADSRGSADEQSEAINRLIDRGVDGLLVVPQKGTSPTTEKVPMVVINTASDPNNSVSADHAGGGALIARHIADLGHEKVVVLGGDPISEVQRDRISGMKAALPDAVQTTVLWGDQGIEDVPEKVSRGATAVMTTSDLLALRVRSRLMQSGLSVPEDVSLTGFDNLSIATSMHPALTTVAQDVEAIADRAIALIAGMIDGGPAPEIGQTIPMRLVARNSTACPQSIYR